MAATDKKTTSLEDFILCEIKNGIAKMQPFEAEGHWKQRLEFLTNVLYNYVAQAGGNVEILKKSLPHICVLSAVFYNAKILGCQYSQELQEEMALFDPEATDFLTMKQRTQDRENCHKFNCQIVLLP